MLRLNVFLLLLTIQSLNFPQAALSSDDDDDENAEDAGKQTNSSNLI